MIRKRPPAPIASTPSRHVAAMFGRILSVDRLSLTDMSGQFFKTDRDGASG
jgi:hypothetical protein